MHIQYIHFNILRIIILGIRYVLKQTIRIKLLQYIKNSPNNYAIVQKRVEMKCAIKLLFRNTLCEWNVKHTYNFENKINEFYNSRTL